MARKARSHTLIQDKLIEPYFITIDDMCHTVNQTVQKNSDHFRSKGKSKSYEKAISFHPNLGSALFAISKYLKHDKETRDLDAVLDQYKTIENNLKQFIDEQVNSVL
tara:strand:- start:1235 stop:1555 length:321 start_codon:yes stop_codon:yes gene_type:complete